MKLKFLIYLLVIWTVSCTPFPQQTMQDIKKDIAFQDVLQSPEHFRGESVIWGGVIVETITKPQHTLIIVRQTELDFQKRPKDLDRSAGRFIIFSPGFLDPAIYGQHREITVVGTIKGKENRLIGEHLYVYPVIEPRALHLWETWENTSAYYDPWYFWMPYPSYYYPWRPYPRPRY
mgnify:FL=1